MILPAALATVAALSASVPQETTHYPAGDLGEAHVFAPSGTPRGVAVVLSGDGGWKPAEASGRLVEALAQRGLLAIGLDVNAAMAQMSRDKATYDLSGELKKVAADAAHRYDVKGPLYFGGYSAGATLAYAAAAQSPRGDVAGLVTTGFCPDQETDAPVGDAEGRTIGHRVSHVAGWVYRPVALPMRWGLIEGDGEHGCPGGAVADFVSRVPTARLWTAKGVRHSFTPPQTWRPDLDAALDDVLGG